MSLFKQILFVGAVAMGAALPALAQNSAAGQAIADCHARAWQPYRAGEVEAMTVYADALRAEWRKQTEAAIASSVRPSIRTRRTTLFTRANALLDRGLARWQSDEALVTGKDDTQLANIVSTASDEERTNAHETWMNHPISHATIDAVLSSLQNLLRQNVNAKNRSHVIAAWTAARHNALNQLNTTIETWRGTYVDDVGACLADLNGDSSTDVSLDQTGDTETNHPVTKQPEQTEAAFRVKTVAIETKALNQNTCDTSYLTTGHITVTMAGTVKYTWITSDQVVGAVETLVFDEAGTKDVSFFWRRTHTNPAVLSGWTQLKILSPNVMVSDQSAFTTTCVQTVTKPLPAAQPTIITTDASVAGEVTDVRASVGPTSSQTCIQTFVFDGIITVNGPMVVAYTWDRSDSATGPIQKIVFANAGTQKVQTTWSIGRSYEGWERLRIISPVPKTSSETRFSLACPAPEPEIQAISVQATVDPESVTPAICKQTFALRGTITANRAGTLRYRWERSDGLSYPESTVSFSQAGTKIVSDTWYLDMDTKAWVRLHVLGTNERFSDRASLTLACPAPVTPEKETANASNANVTTTNTTNANTTSSSLISSASVSVDKAQVAICGAQTFQFTGTIMASAASDIRYRWERSDQSNAAEQRVSLPSGGTKTVTDSWNVSGAFTGSNWLHVLFPNDVSSNHVAITLTQTCQTQK